MPGESWIKTKQAVELLAAEVNALKSQLDTRAQERIALAQRQRAELEAFEAETVRILENYRKTRMQYKLLAEAVSEIQQALPQLEGDLPAVPLPDAEWSGDENPPVEEETPGGEAQPDGE